MSATDLDDAWPYGQIHLYPNPTEDRLMIQFDEGLRHPVEITLFDLAGRQHMARQVDVRGTTRLNLGHLPRGIYLVRIKVGDQYANRKVIVN